MPTYTQVKNLDLEKLSTAVEAWQKLSGKVIEAQRTFNSKVAKGLESSDWSGDAADAAFTKIHGLRYQIDTSRSEADSVHTFLNSVLFKLRWARRQLRDMEAELADHPHLSANPENGAVSVDEKKVPDADERKELTVSYRETVKSYKDTVRKVLETAQDTDRLAKWAFQHMGESYRSGFTPTSPTSLVDAAKMRLETATSTQGSKPLSLKELSDREVAAQRKAAAASKPGGGTLAQTGVEFLSYRAWMNSGASLVKGDVRDAHSYFVDGTPAYVAGEGSKFAEHSPGGGGKHRKPAPINVLGKAGGKIFSTPVGIGATVLDFYYTPPDATADDPDAKILAPKDPGKVHWK